MANPVGRPWDYSPELADEILEEIENSPRGIDHICAENPRFPIGRTFRRWLKQFPELRPKYDQSKTIQAEKMADEMLDVAYYDKKDWKVIVDDQGNEKTVHVSEAVNRSRLKIDTLKWHASKLAPKKYGEKLQSSHTTEGSLLEKLIDKL